MIQKTSKVLNCNTLKRIAVGICLANQKRRTIGFSIRIDEEWLETLRAESERQGISVNALTNRLLKNYCLHWRWVERFSGVLISRPTIASIIDCCSDDRIEQIAKTSGVQQALKTCYEQWEFFQHTTIWQVSSRTTTAHMPIGSTTVNTPEEKKKSFIYAMN